MKKYLIFFLLSLSQFSTHAEGTSIGEIQLLSGCLPSSPVCKNCPEHQTLFPIEQFSPNTGNLDIEADESEIINEKYFLSGDVKVSSDNLFLSADNVEVSSKNNSLLATGQVKFQDEDYLITSDLLNATRDEEGELIATASNANYQDFSAGIGGANGYANFISKTPTSVVLTDSTYSLCPVNDNDWLIDADRIELNLDKNRGFADNAIIKFYGVPIFFMPKYSWVVSGRGSGLLTPSYSTYTDIKAKKDQYGRKKSSYSFRLPYYINLAPDRDLVVALTWMSSRGFLSEGKYRQLIAPKISSEHEESILIAEAKYLPQDKKTNLKRWLLNFTQEIDFSDKLHLSTQYYRVSDKEYFKEIARTSTHDKTLYSNLELTYTDIDANLSMGFLTEDIQVVNAGAPIYTRAAEGSINKTLLSNTRNPISVGFISTNFAHKKEDESAGIRTHLNLGISRTLGINYPTITPKAGITITQYALKNNPNILRKISNYGLDIDFTKNYSSSMFGFEANHKISPLISYNYRARKVQGNIPIFDSEDTYAEIITFAGLTSGERYSGLDRITNRNDITVSLESTYRAVDAKDIDKDLLSLKVAQSFYTDNEVVSATTSTNFETRKSYSDIAASIDIAVGNYVFSHAGQFNPDTSKLVNKTNTLSYISSSRKFLSLAFIDGGRTKTEKFYGALPLTNSIHLFGGLDKITSTGIRVTETSGIAYESCCWAFRLAHFKEDNTKGGYSYSTSGELILTGLGSTQSSLNGRIESYIPGYRASLD